MEIPPNLISDSTLIQETFDLLSAGDGRASFSNIADSVFRLSNLDAELAARLIEDLVGNDPRFSFEETQLALNSNLQELRPLSDIEFVVLDVEAVVARHMPARIIELGAYRLKHGEIVDEFQTLINPEVRIPRFISTLTGITDEMLKNAPLFPETLNEWLEFAGDAVLVAHNAAFDLDLLNAEIARCFPGYRMRNAELCTVDLARRIIRNADGHNLDALAEHFGIDIDERHRAGSDALATARLFQRLLEELELQGVTTLNETRVFRTTHKSPAKASELNLALNL